MGASGWKCCVKCHIKGSTCTTWRHQRGLRQASDVRHALSRVQVKVQTVPGFAKGLTDGFPKFIALEGAGG